MYLYIIYIWMGLSSWTGKPYWPTGINLWHIFEKVWALKTCAVELPQESWSLVYGFMSANMPGTQRYPRVRMGAEMHISAPLGMQKYGECRVLNEPSAANLYMKNVAMTTCQPHVRWIVWCFPLVNLPRWCFKWEPTSAVSVIVIHPLDVKCGNGNFMKFSYEWSFTSLGKVSKVSIAGGFAKPLIHWSAEDRRL